MIQKLIRTIGNIGIIFVLLFLYVTILVTALPGLICFLACSCAVVLGDVLHERGGEAFITFARQKIRLP